jgi:hypothetical protein
MRGVEKKLLSSPPGKYGRKTETLRNWRGRTTRGAACGLIQLNAENLTRGDGRMKVVLKTLPDEPRGSAWPPSARAVRCPVKSGNEQDLHPQLLTNSVIEHIVETAHVNGRKVQATVGLYAPNPLGYTRATMVRTMGRNSERRSKSSKPYPSSDRGLQPTLVTSESLVISRHHLLVNMSLRLAHTARQTNRAGFR